MTTNELRQWVEQQLALLGEPQVGESPTPDNALIVETLKHHCLAAGLPELSLSLPVENSKRRVSAVAQLQRVLASIDQPAEFLDIHGVSDLLGCSERTIKRGMITGEIPQPAITVNSIQRWRRDQF